MTRVKRGVISLKRRRNVLRQTKGFHWGRKSKERAAREALLHAGRHAFHGRRKKKGFARRLWNIKIGATLKTHGMSYSKFIHALKESNIRLDRKILSALAEQYPDIFEKIISETKIPTLV